MSDQLWEQQEWEDLRAHGSRVAHVRPAIWGLLTASLLLASLAPVLVLWHVAMTPLAAHACVWPSDPQAGQTAYVLVVLENLADQGTFQEAGGRVVVDLDMSAMPMRTSQLVAQGSPDMDDRGGIFAIPLHLEMEGAWWARVTLQAPARPDWQALLRFTVSPAHTPALLTTSFMPIATSVPMSPHAVQSPCGQSPPT